MGTQLPPEKGHTHPTDFLAHVYCGQTAGWMNTPLGTEVNLGPGHIVLDGVRAIRERGTAAPLLFSANVYCGHGLPSYLLLSSCYKGQSGTVGIQEINITKKSMKCVQRSFEGNESRIKKQYGQHHVQWHNVEQEKINP